MLRKVLLFMIVAAAAALPASAQTADEVVARYVKAIGGPEKMKAVNTVRLTGRMTVGPGLEAPIVIEKKRPNAGRIEFTVQGLTGVQAYDGKNGWQVMPFGPSAKKDPEPLGEDDLKDAEEQADFDGPLVDARAKGNKVELLGKEPVEGTDTYKLKVALKSGDIRYYYLDADSYLPIKEEGKRTIRGTEREFESAIGDYKAVEGLMIAFSIENGIKGSPQKQKVTIEKVELNLPIDDARFKMPDLKKP